MVFGIQKERLKSTLLGVIFAAYSKTPLPVERGISKKSSANKLVKAGNKAKEMELFSSEKFYERKRAEV